MLGSKLRILLLIIPSFIILSCSNGVNFAVPQTTQEFNQQLAYNNKVDFLFIIDNSASMNKVRVNLYNSLQGLVTTLNQLKLDFRVAATSTTMASWYPMAGRFFGEPKYITAETPDFQNRLSEKVLIDSAGGSVERGLDSMKSVLSEAYQNSEGQNFLRNDSLLVIIYLTNEDDKSEHINSGNAGNQAKHYSDFLDNLKPVWSNGERSWIFNFVGITSLNDTCNTGDFSGYKEPGLRLMEMANKSKGRVESICQVNLGYAVSNIKARIMQFLTDYKLNKVPNLSSIKVFINGAEIPMDNTNGWSYISQLNVIRFNGNIIPKSDADIRIDFTPDQPN